MLAACTGQIGDKVDPRSPPDMRRPGGAGTTGGTTTGGGTPPDVFASCDANKPTRAPAPLVRLTNGELAATLRDLFPMLQVSALKLAPDNVDEGFDDVASAQSVSSALIEGYDGAASQMAALAVARLATVLPCSAAMPIDEAGCGGGFVRDLAKRAYRRTPGADELARLSGLFDTARTRWGFAKGIELTIRAVLQSPLFLYRAELGSPSPDRPDTTALTSAEVASRLSYLLWDSMPDAELTRAADADELVDPAAVEKQARRLMADPRAKSAIATFHGQWLRFEKMASLTKSKTLFPSFDAATAGALRDSAAAYVDYLFWQKGTLEGFLTDRMAFVSDPIAPIYGLPPSGSSKLELREVDPNERAGILTHAGLLSGFAHETSDAPVLRGVFVLDRFLCSSPPPPPPGVPPLGGEMPGDTPMTTRQRVETTHSRSTCLGCHGAIDGIGFGFSAYDAIGAHRTEENGLPIDATGRLPADSDVGGPFDGAVELGKRLAASKQVEACVAQQWYRYALGLSKQDVDVCSVKRVVERTRASGFDLRELLVELVKDDIFRRRAIVAPGP
jgi:hypothetical protein